MTEQTGQYRRLRRLAVGGMGEVHLATQQTSAGIERAVIVKSLLPDLAADPAFVRQFLDEARVIARLTHPSIVALYDVFEEDDNFHIAMELIRGASLAEILSRGATLDVEVAAFIAREAADGLAHAHAQEVIHRDVSPSNLMIDLDGRTRIVDFGIALANDRLTKTETGTVKGKLSYMSLEQLSGAPLDGRADQYALGVVLWELLVGRRLFDRQNVVELVQSREIEAPSSVRGEVPRAVDEVVMRMLAAERDARFLRCDDVVHALDAWGRERPGYSQAGVRAALGPLVETLSVALEVDSSGSTKVLAPSTKALDTSGERTRRPVRAALVVGLAFIALAAALVFFWPRPERTEDREQVPLVVRQVIDAGQPEVRAPEPKPERRKQKRRRSTTTNTTTGFGELSIVTKPWTEVWIGKRFLGSTPLYKVRVKAGKHRLRFVNKSLKLSRTKTIALNKGQALKVNEDFR